MAGAVQVLLASLLAAVLPMALWAWLVWRADRYEREPLPLILLSLFWGAFPAVALALLAEAAFSRSLDLRNGLPSELISASGVTPLAEELAKGAGLAFIALFWHDEIDDVLDGITYGAMVGFGFAATENVFYFMAAGATAGWVGWGEIVFVRGVLFGLNHAFFSAFLGAGIGYARIASSWRGRAGAPILGLMAALAAHGLHNLGTAMAPEAPGALLISLASDSGGLLLTLLLAGLAMQNERSWLLTQLACEVGGLITREEYDDLCSWSGRAKMLTQARRSGGWRAARAATTYQQLAGELAFHLHRQATRGSNPQSLAEIENLRRRIVCLRLTAGIAAGQNTLLSPGAPCQASPG